MISAIFACFALFLAPLVTALNNGLARTPPMGWNPYNAFLWVTFSAQ